MAGSVAPVAEIVVDGPAGRLKLECADNWLARWRCAAILRGQTYPLLPIPGPVRTIVDVGANCGATSVLLAAAYPDATVHALEPASEPFALLRRNSADRPPIRPHNVGLADADRTGILYLGELDSGTSSLIPPDGGARTEEVTLRGAAEWLREQGIEGIDVLKVDVEGTELEVLLAMREWLPRVRVLHLEYGGLGTGRLVDDLLRGTHQLAIGSVMLTHGEVTYVADELVGDELITAVGERVRDAVLAQRPAPDEPG